MARASGSADDTSTGRRRTMTTKLLENCACGKCHATPTRGTKQVTVAEATAMVKATCEKLEKHMTPADPNAGRTVVGMYLTPRGLGDKNGGRVVKAVRVGPKQA